MKLFIHVLKYKLGKTQIPSITGTMYQANGDSSKASDRQLVDFTKFFNSSVLSRHDFYTDVRYTKWNDSLRRAASGIKKQLIRIRILPSSFQVNISKDVSVIELTFNEAAFKLFNLKIEEFKPPSPNTISFNHTTKQYKIGFRKSYESFMNLDVNEVTFDGLKELMLRSKFESDTSQNLQV